MWFQAPFSGPLPRPQPPDLNRPPPPPPQSSESSLPGQGSHHSSAHPCDQLCVWWPSGGQWPSHLPRWMRRNKERQAWDGAMELEDSSGASRPPIFYIEGDPTSRMKGREPGPPAY